MPIDNGHDGHLGSALSVEGPESETVITRLQDGATGRAGQPAGRFGFMIEPRAPDGTQIELFAPHDARTFMSAGIASALRAQSR